jgi:hypothetical protein
LWLVVKSNEYKAKMVENTTDYKYSSAMCHAGLVNNSLVTDYDIGVLPSEYQDYLKSMVKRGRYPFLGLPLFLKLKSLPTLSLSFRIKPSLPHGKPLCVFILGNRVVLKSEMVKNMALIPRLIMSRPLKESLPMDWQYPCLQYQVHCRE